MCGRNRPGLFTTNLFSRARRFSGATRPSLPHVQLSTNLRLRTRMDRGKPVAKRRGKRGKGERGNRMNWLTVSRHPIPQSPLSLSPCPPLSPCLRVSPSPCLPFSCRRALLPFSPFPLYPVPNDQNNRRGGSAGAQFYAS